MSGTTTAPAPAFSEHALVVDGVRTRMLRGGQGERLLFLHGAAGLTGWPSFFETLSQHYDVWFPEHPGFGQSEAPDSLSSIAALARYYRRFIDDMGVGPCHLVGSSLGGWLAAEVAVLGDVPLRSLTLVGPAGLRPRATPPADVPAPTAEDLTRRLFFNQAIAERLLAQPSTEAQQQAQARNRATVARLGGSFYNPQLEAALARVDVPALVLWGEQDRVVPVAQAALWAGALPRASTCIVPACGHLPHLEKPAEGAEALLGFLRGAG